jgi:hypothetical protein
LDVGYAEVGPCTKIKGFQALAFEWVGMLLLLSVNAGLPRDVTWDRKTVGTAIWKRPVEGRQMVRKLYVFGDAQADLAGHGVGSGGAPFLFIRWMPIPTGNTFSVEALPDTEVCIGDRYR